MDSETAVEPGACPVECCSLARTAMIPLIGAISWLQEAPAVELGRCDGCYAVSGRRVQAGRDALTPSGTGQRVPSIRREHLYRLHPPGMPMTCVLTPRLAPTLCPSSCAAFHSVMFQVLHI